MRKKIILASILTLVTTGIFAQGKHLKDSTETKQLSKRVADLFRQNEVNKAFSELTPYWPIPANEIESMTEKTLKYLNILEDRFGKAIGVGKVKNEKISDIAIRETYFVRYQNSAIRLKFTYYKNNEGWIVNAFKWDDSFTEEFQ